MKLFIFILSTGKDTKSKTLHMNLLVSGRRPRPQHPDVEGIVASHMQTFCEVGRFLNH